MIVTNKKQVKIYVNSLLLILKKKNALLSDFFQVGNELFLINAFICSSEKTRSFFLQNNSLDKLKYKILLELFPGISSLTKLFLDILLKKRHIYLLSSINDEFQEKFEKIQRISRIKIVISSSLSNDLNTLDKFYTQIIKVLKSSFKSTYYIFQIYFDPKLLGGIIFEHDTFFLDLSIKNSLKKLVNIS